jgi:hypothetical protein
VNVYARAFVRFWWILLIGAAVSVAVIVGVAKKHKPPTFYATAELLLDTADHPFLRTSIVRAAPQGTRTQVVRVPGSSTTQTVTVPDPTQYVVESPNTQTLISAANFYPQLIDSDPFKAFRAKLFGQLPGNIYPTAIGARQGMNRFVQSPFPLIQLVAIASRPVPAKHLATATAIAFQKWLIVQQRGARIPPSQRISARPLVMPALAYKKAHKHTGLAVLAGVAAFAAFLALAAGLDRVLPRRRSVASEVRDYVEPPSTREVEVPTEVRV